MTMKRLLAVVSAVVALGVFPALPAEEMPATEIRKEFTISQKYLILPIQNGGGVYLPLAVNPAETQPALTATAGRGEVKARLLRVYELKSIWE